MSSAYFCCARCCRLTNCGMIFLQTLHRHATLLERTNAECARPGRANCGDDRNSFRQGRAPNLDFIPPRNLTARRVDDELDLSVLDEVADVGPTLRDLEHL